MESADTKKVEVGWRSLLDHADVGPKVRSMIEAAGRRSDLRRLFPYLSLHRTLKFSHTAEYPYTEGMPSITYVDPDAVLDGPGYDVRDAALKPTRFGELEVALSHLAGLARKRPPDVEAIVRYLPTDDGGRKTPAHTGYKPCHLVKPDYLTSGKQDFIDRETVAPGEAVWAHITFISPEAYPHSLRPGQIISVQEGNRVVGHAEIVTVLNPDLLAGESDGEEK